MIARVWTARATADGAGRYRAHFAGHVLPALRSIDGYAGASLLSRAAEEAVEIVVVTRWRSLDAVRAFAGPDSERAVVAPEAVPLLLRWDDRVRHYEIALSEEVA
jgi:heme-degrading monooxygenase HmoA